MQSQWIAPQLSSLLASFSSVIYHADRPVKKSVTHKRREVLNGKGSRRYGKRLPAAGDDHDIERAKRANNKGGLALTPLLFGSR